MTTTPRRPVTVVVPVYGDLPGLENCIAALLTSIDFTVDRVLLSNDSGPEGDIIERRLLDLVGDHPGFEYSRNASNLGFVRNCNRAAFQLDSTGNDLLFLNSDTVPMPGFVDELAAVLASDESIGAVCARSDNATIASLPFARRAPNTTTTPQRAQRLHENLTSLLPRTTPVPVAMGFCFLVRREVVNRFGLFDEAFSPGYGEENDFCLRINEHGYRSVFANHALVLHSGSTSFTRDRSLALRLEHERILLERYPYYAGAVDLFLSRFRDAVDVFADAFLPDDGLLRVALQLPAALTPEVVHQVQAVRAAAPDDVVLTVIASRKQLRAARRAFPGAAIAADDRPRQIFDIAVALGTLTSFHQLAVLNANAPRWVVVGSAAHPDRWSDAVLHHRSSAIDRIVRRFEDCVVAWEDADALLRTVRTSGEAPIDPHRLRERWIAVTEIAEATGQLTHASTVSRRRLTALSIGARIPRLPEWLRRLRRH